MKSHVISHPCRLKPARFRRLDCRKRRIVVGGLKYEPLDALVIALPRASPPPPPVSAAGAGAGAGAGAAAAAPGLQRRGGGGAAHGPSARRPRRRCNVIRWNACAVGGDDDGVGVGGVRHCTSTHEARGQIRQAVGWARRACAGALEGVGGWGMVSGWWWWGLKVTVNQGSRV